jgi:hypothetical protein
MSNLIPINKKATKAAQRWAERMNLMEEFVSWLDINSRCYVPSHPRYPEEGGKGASVCEQWRWDREGAFKMFILDMGTIAQAEAGVKVTPLSDIETIDYPNKSRRDR